MIYFAQAIRERKTYTDFLIGLIMLNRYYQNSKKTFFIKSDVVNVFENEENTFYNIEDNNSYKLLRAMRLKAVEGIKEDPMHRDDTLLKKMYIERITKERDINDMYLYGLRDGRNFLLDNTVKFYYLEKHDDNNLHYFNNDNKQIDKGSLKIKNKINYNKELCNSFTKDKFFINLPTFRLQNDYDIKILDLFCKFLVNETPYKNLILISGSNFYKDYFCDKFGFETTHFYDNGFSSKKLGFRKQEGGFKCKDKGSLESLLMDCFYIQESSASYIDFMKVYNRYRDDLLKYGLKKFTHSYYDTFITRNKSQAIDIIGKELKGSKIFYQ